eukprot:1297273-Rhodomonas_salina.3
MAQMLRSASTSGGVAICSSDADDLDGWLLQAPLLHEGPSMPLAADTEHASSKSSSIFGARPFLSIIPSP